jgi:hypothetical protein
MSQLFKNNVKSRLKEAIDAAVTSFAVTADHGNLYFPTLPSGDDHMLITLENSTGDKEIVKVIERAGDTFTVGSIPGAPSVLGRGQEGTTAMGFEAGDLVELRLTAGFIDALKEGSIVYVIDGGDAEIGAGQKGWIEVPFNGTIKSVRLFADQPGGIVIDIWKDSYINYPPDNTWDSITGATQATITDPAQKSQDSSLADWTRNFSKGDIFAFNVDSCTTITRCTISMTVDRW